jgi:Kef-type K+ transport system membrane component KefB
MLLLPSFLALMLLVRGLPVLLYRHQLPREQRLPFALSSSVSSLGLVVVLTEIGRRTQTMSADIAQALVGAALLSTLIFPIAAAVCDPALRRPQTDA